MPLTTTCPGNFENHSCVPSFAAFTSTLPYTDNYERYVNTTYLDEDESSERWQWIAVQVIRPPSHVSWQGGPSTVLPVGLTRGVRNAWQATLLPNGTSPPGCSLGSKGCKEGPIVHVNITRNYTFTIGKEAVDESGRRPMLRYEWTQGMPFTANARARDCFVFDYSLGYTAGPDAVPPERFAPPGGVASCVPV